MIGGIVLKLVLMVNGRRVYGNIAHQDTAWYDNQIREAEWPFLYRGDRFRVCSRSYPEIYDDSDDYINELPYNALCLRGSFAHDDHREYDQDMSSHDDALRYQRAWLAGLLSISRALKEEVHYIAT